MALINTEAGPGEEKDSIFVHKLMTTLWDKDTLMKRSVTGRKSNAHRHNEQKPALENNKLQFIYGMLINRHSFLYDYVYFIALISIR